MPAVADESHIPAVAAAPVEQPAVEVPSQAAQEAEDDSANIGPNDPVLLVVENDTYFVRVLLDVVLGEQGFKVEIAGRGSDCAYRWRAESLRLAAHHAGYQFAGISTVGGVLHRLKG